MSIGWSAQPDTIELNRGDWIAERTSDQGDFPPGTTVTVEWASGQSWPALVDGATVAWRVESADHQHIVDGTPFSIMVRYPNERAGGTDDYEWCEGVAVRTNAAH